MQSIKPIVPQWLRFAAGASLAAVLAASPAAYAQTSMQAAPSDSMKAPTRTPQGARGETPHYPASGVAGQGAEPMQGMSPGGNGMKPHTRKPKGARGENPHYPAPGMPGQGGSAVQGN